MNADQSAGALAHQPDLVDLDGHGLVYASVNDTPACAALCRHRSGVLIMGSVALTPLPPGQARRAFGPLVWGAPRRLLAEPAAVAKVLAAIAKPTTRPWLEIAARLPASAAPLLHHAEVRPVLLAALALCGCSSTKH